MKTILRDGISLDSVSYRINIQCDDAEELIQTAEINPVLSITSSEKTVLLASLTIDGHELLPAVKVEINSGSQEYFLPNVSIKRRRHRKLKFEDMPSDYKVELILSCDGINRIGNEQNINLNDFC